MLQEFDISITAVGNDRYLVRTEQVAPGVPLAQEQFHWPIDDWLAESATLMHDPLLGILQGESSQRWATRPNYRSGRNDGGEPSEQIPTLVGLGQALYNNLFDRTLRDSWLTAQGVAHNRRSILRLRLGLKGDKLQKLPWEVLHAGDRPLGTGTDVTFSRYHLERRQGYDRSGATMPDFEQPLRVLMVIAAPTDQDRLELAREAKHLQEELHPVIMRSGSEYGLLPKQQLDVQLTVLEQPGRSELTQALEQGNYQALHYAGHSNLGNAGGDLYLVSRQTGLTERISGEDLAGLLSNNGVKLAVLNSCRGAYSQGSGQEAGWHEQNLAQALVNRGIPGVIAMAERIPDDVAITFTQLLYRNLKQGNPIDLCLNRTRQGLISAHGSNYSYWSLPILYMQPGFDGYLASKPGNDNSALDRLLESEDPLAPLDKPDGHPSETTVSEGFSPGDVDLDKVVETFHPDEIVANEEDEAADIKQLVEQLSQPSQPEEVIPASEDEPLIPDTLETPGLELYNQLPKKTVKPSVDEADEAQPTIYEAEETPEQVSEPLESVTSKPGMSRRRRQQIAMGIGAAAVLGVVGVSVSDPFKLLDNNPAPQLSNTSEETVDVPPSVGLSSDDSEVVVASLNTMASENGLQATLDTLVDSRVGDDPAKLFAQGQLQWIIATQGLPADDAVKPRPSAAMLSWEDLLKLQPDWLATQVALGFTYYEQERLQDAIAIWEAAINNPTDEQENTIPILTPPDAAVSVRNTPDKLHAYAGLAIAYHELADQQVLEADQQAKSRSYATEFWLQANDLAEAQSEMVIDVVSDHWLWSEKALENWLTASEAIPNYPDLTN
ncbi:MAG: CHAT domain-containing protein [Cyanobacteria bacterium P01_D01_bin.56]